MKEIPEKKEGFLKSVVREIGDSVIAGVIWNVIIFIPRMIARMWKIFD